jgi:hypothetical protein
MRLEAIPELEGHGREPALHRSVVVGVAKDTIGQETRGDKARRPLSSRWRSPTGSDWFHSRLDPKQLRRFDSRDRSRWRQDVADLSDGNNFEWKLAVTPQGSSVLKRCWGKEAALDFLWKRERAASGGWP